MTGTAGGEMPEPTVAYPIRDVLSRIEAKLDTMGNQLREFEVEGSRTAREALAAEHALELRVRELELNMISGTAVASAISRARASFWAAVAATGTAASAIALILTRH